MMDNEKNISNAKKTTAAKLLYIDCIFRWKPIIYEENIREVANEFEPESRNQFSFYNFIIRLVNCYKSFEESKSSDLALKRLDELILAANKFNEDGDGRLFKKIKEAYYHMVNGSKALLLIENGEHQEAAKVIEKIKLFEEMDDNNKAAFHAMKSAVFALYSNEDKQKAFASIDKALKLDDDGLWYFLKGLYIRRIRRMTNPFESPSPHEKEQFEKAFEKEPSNVVFKLHIADIYREITKHALQRSEACSHFLPRDNTLNDILKSKIDQQIHLSAQYYKEVAEAFPDCPYVMFRAADGLAKLPKGLNDIGLAKKLTKNGLKLSPENVCGNLVQAFLYEKFDKNTKNALKHLKICSEKSIFDADMNLIRILHTSKPDQLNGIKVLEELMVKYKEKARHAIIYSQIVSYYIFVKHDLIKANENATLFYELNFESTCMQTHRSCFIATAEPFSLIDVLIDDVKYAVNGHSNSEALQNSCKKFLQFMNFQNIIIVQGFPQNFRKQILEGKPMKVNDKYVQNSVKPQTNKVVNKRVYTNQKNGFGKERTSQSTTGRPNTRNLTNPGNNRNNETPPRKPPNNVEIPSLMDIYVSKSVAKNVEEKFKKEPTIENVVEKHVEQHSEEKNDSSSDSEMGEMFREMVRQVKKKSQAKGGKSKNKIEVDESIVKLLKLMGLGNEKNTRGKKHRSDSDSENYSDYRRRENRRRKYSRRRHRSRSDSEDDSERYSRCHRRRKHRSSDSENSTRSVRRKDHKKDRYDHDYSPRDKHHRRRNHSSDDDFDYKPTYRRNDSVSRDRKRCGRRDSVSSRRTRDRSLSYEKRTRSSLKKSKSSRHRSTSLDERRRESGNSASSIESRDRSPSYDKTSRRNLKREKSGHPERKISSKRDEVDKTTYAKKFRRRSSSRIRGNKNAMSKKEEESFKNTSKRDQNSRRSGEE